MGGSYHVSNGIMSMLLRSQISLLNNLGDVTRYSNIRSSIVLEPKMHANMFDIQTLGSERKIAQLYVTGAGSFWPSCAKRAGSRFRAQMRFTKKPTMDRF